MSLENIIVSEINHLKKTNLKWFHLDEMFTMGMSTEIENQLVVVGGWGGEVYVGI